MCIFYFSFLVAFQKEYSVCLSYAKSSKYLLMEFFLCSRISLRRHWVTLLSLFLFTEALVTLHLFPDIILFFSTLTFSIGQVLPTILLVIFDIFSNVACWIYSKNLTRALFTVHLILVIFSFLKTLNSFNLYSLSFNKCVLVHSNKKGLQIFGKLLFKKFKTSCLQGTVIHFLRKTRRNWFWRMILRKYDDFCPYIIKFNIYSQTIYRSASSKRFIRRILSIFVLWIINLYLNIMQNRLY